MSASGALRYGVARLRAHRSESASNRADVAREHLLNDLDAGTVVAFVGAGCSRALNRPGWTQLVRDLVEKALGHLPQPDASTKAETHDRERLERFLAQLLKRGGTTASSDEGPSWLAGDDFSQKYPFVLGECRRILGVESEIYRKKLKHDFHDDRGGDEGAVTGENPTKLLLQLGIERFITTNYDNEIERAIEAEKARIG